MIDLFLIPRRRKPLDILALLAPIKRRAARLLTGRIHNLWPLYARRSAIDLTIGLAVFPVEEVGNIIEHRGKERGFLRSEALLMLETMRRIILQQHPKRTAH